MEEEKMRTKIGILILAGTFILMAAVPMNALAGRAGKMSGQAQQIRTQLKQQIRDQQRLRDGFCLDPAQKGSGPAWKKGNTYGPGDGAGNNAIGPKDGRGYGVPSNR
jgi:type II secretory pathway pseudopilin PulG